MHSCCAPCSTATLKWLGEHYPDSFTFYFYNPYIHPFLEFELRKQSFINYMEKKDVPYYVSDKFEIDSLYDYRKTNIIRCEHCYIKRLETTVKFAKSKGFTHFSTTLLISPYQQHELIKKIGNELADKYSIEFLYEDLRPLFNSSKQLSKDEGLYRQQYCGCIVSEYERYVVEKRKKGKLKQVDKILKVYESKD